MLNHFAKLLGPPFGSPTRLGRCGPPPSTRALSPDKVALPACPLWNVTMPARAQPPTTFLRAVFCDLKNGSS